MQCTFGPAKDKRISEGQRCIYRYTYAYTEADKIVET